MFTILCIWLSSIVTSRMLNLCQLKTQGLSDGSVLLWVNHWAMNRGTWLPDSETTPSSQTVGSEPLHLVLMLGIGYKYLQCPFTHNVLWSYSYKTLLAWLLLKFISHWIRKCLSYYKSRTKWREEKVIMFNHSVPVPLFCKFLFLRILTKISWLTFLSARKDFSEILTQWFKINEVVKNSL